jgi:hypothetical protein
VIPLCCTENHVSDGIVSGVVAAFFYGIAAILRATWWLLIHAIGPGLLVLAVAGWRWTTGAPQRTSRPGRARLLTRPLRAALQNVVTLLAVGILVNPAATVAAFTVVAVLAGGTVIGLRWRAKRRTGPRRVKVTIGRPVPSRAASPVAAITDTAEGTTWTEHQVNAARRAA